MAALLIWHGYLLHGTGSNIYTASMARAWVQAGHDVVLLCQDRNAGEFGFVTAIARHTHTDATLNVRELRKAQPGRGQCTVVLPDISGVLPVYVLDRYEGFMVRRLVDMNEEEIALYMARNAEALELVLDHFDVSGALVNHAALGPAAQREVFERAGVPYAVKVHGSELEYALASDDRQVGHAQHGLEGARRVLVGSNHIARRTAGLVGEHHIAGKVEVIPPGVDVDHFAPVSDNARPVAHELLCRLLAQDASRGHGIPADHRERVRDALAAASDTGASPVEGLLSLQTRYEERDPDVDVAQVVRAIDPQRHPVVSFIGKLIPQKGPQLVIAAWPLVLQRHPEARLVLVGFGPLREGLEAMVAALSAGDLGLLRDLATHGGALAGEGNEPFAHVVQFLDDMTQVEQGTYLSAARACDASVVFTGPLQHRHLAPLCQVSRACVVPSVLPEAFGMIAAEAASCGCVPIVSAHSGLAEVATALAANVDEKHARLLNVPIDAGVVRALAELTNDVISLPSSERRELTQQMHDTVRREWSWQSVAERVANALS